MLIPKLGCVFFLHDFHSIIYKLDFVSVVD